MSNVVFDEILGKVRAGDVNSGGGSGGTSYIGGDRINIAGGTISFVNSADIVNVTGTSVTLQPDTAYKIYATSHAITLNANPPAAGKWAYEGHLEIFVASTGYIVTGSNVVLANALEPDAVNNCTVRFHDGLAIISVEDHVAGYIVVYASGSTSGTLPFGIGTAEQEYIAFDATLNGSTIDLSGSTANGEKHIVGNGYTSTTLTGAVDCGTNKFTVANLSLQDVGITGGTLTLGDAYIPSGSTVAVSGGGLAVEKVTGNGGVFDLGGTQIITTQTANMSNIMLTGGTGGTSAYGGAIKTTVSLYLTGATITNNTATVGGGAIYFMGNTYGEINNCLITENGSFSAPQYGGAFSVGSNCHLVISGSTITNNKAKYGVGAFEVPLNVLVEMTDSIISGNNTSGGAKRNMVVTGGTAFFHTGNTIEGCIVVSGGSVVVEGSNHILGQITSSGTESGSVTISSGAIVDLTDNENPTPIAPGGGITFEQGGATILTGGTAGVVDAQYMLGGITLNSLGNTDVVSGYEYLPLIASGGSLVYTNNDNVFPRPPANASCYFADCELSTNRGYFRAANSNFTAHVALDKKVKFNKPLIGATSDSVANISIYDGATVNFSGATELGSALIDCDAGTLTIGSGCAIVTVNGATVSLTEGTFTRILNDGTTE